MPGRDLADEGSNTDGPRTSRRVPFAQARESMFALRRAIADHFGRASPEATCPIGSAVVFPDVACPPDSPEFERSDVIDAEDLRRPVSSSIKRVVESRLRPVPAAQRRPSSDRIPDQGAGRLPSGPVSILWSQGPSRWEEPRKGS